MESDRSSFEAGAGAHQAALHAVLALLVEERQSRLARDKSASKTEVILPRLGATGAA